MNRIDARGLACPAPVLQVKAAIEESNPGRLSVLVDNEAAKQNVARFLESQSYQADVEQNGSEFVVTGRRGREVAAAQDQPLKDSDPETRKIMVMMATDRMGRGDDELGKKLVVNFVKTLKEMGDDLWRLVCVNNGVKLTIEGADTLADLQELEKKGLQILVCGTCLDHFGLLHKKQVGTTTNMLDIVTAMQLADKVINI